MEDTRMIEAVERYIGGEMSPDERVYFEGLRKSNPEIDQAVVEHTSFLQQMARYEDVRNLKSVLNDTHIHLAERGLIESPRLQGRAKVVYLFNRYKRTAAIAASIAGITALCMSAMMWSVSPKEKVAATDLELLSHEVNVLKGRADEHTKEINQVRAELDAVAPPNTKYTPGGTGFLVDAKGYLVTNSHVVENAKYVAVQNAKGRELRARIVFNDPKRDIAILKIVDTGYTAPAAIPYTIKSGQALVAESIFSLGFPRTDNDIVYGEGYLAAKTGYNGDTLAVQISINANRGNSGSPIINKNGEIIGVLNGRQKSVEGAAFAIQSKYISEAVSRLQKSDTSYQSIKLPTVSKFKGTDRTQQVQKMMDYVYMVKVVN